MRKVNFRSFLKKVSILQYLVMPLGEVHIQLRKMGTI